MYQPEFNFSNISIVWPFGIVVIISLDVDASTLKLRLTVVTPFSVGIDGLLSLLLPLLSFPLLFSPILIFTPFGIKQV